MLMPALLLLLAFLTLSLFGSVALRKSPSLKLTITNVLIFDIGAFAGSLGYATLWNVLGEGLMDRGWFVAAFMVTTPLVAILSGLATVKVLSVLNRAA